MTTSRGSGTQETNVSKFTLRKKQLARLAFNGMGFYLNERLESIQFFTLA
jgi:hypothetical protein